MTDTATAPEGERAGAIEKRPDAALLKTDGSRYTWLDLVTRARWGVLETLMRNGVPPTFASLSGHEFRGGNALILTRIVGIRKFVKGFYEGPPRAAGPEPFLQGYNAKVRQNADHDEHHLLPSREKPKRHDFYRVYRVVPGSYDSHYPNALLLDYGLGGNGIFGAPLRDYLVQVYPDDPDLLLGKAYVALLGLRIPLSFFVLERMHEHDFEG